MVARDRFRTLWEQPGAVMILPGDEVSNKTSLSGDLHTSSETRQKSVVDRINSCGLRSPTYWSVVVECPSRDVAAWRSTAHCCWSGCMDGDTTGMTRDIVGLAATGVLGRCWVIRAPQMGVLPGRRYGRQRRSIPAGARGVPDELA